VAKLGDLIEYAFKRSSIELIFFIYSVVLFPQTGGQELKRNTSPVDGVLDEDTTQTIALTDTFSRDLTATGGFDFSEEIWKTAFGKMIHALPIPTLLLSRSHQIVVANQAWRKVKCDVSEMRGCAFSDFFSTKLVAAKVEDLLQEVFSTRMPRVAQGELEIGENRIWARMTFRPIKALDERLILVLIEDLTPEKRIQEQNRKHREELETRVQERTAELKAANERLETEIADLKKAEEMLLHTERLKAVGELADGAANNFNNVLQTITGATQLATISLETGNLAGVRTSLQQILESSESGSETVRCLQSFTRVCRPNSSRNDCAFDLCDVVRPAAELTKPWWKTNPEKLGVHVNLNLNLNPGCVVSGNRREIFEVVVNLIKNAAEALPNGGDIHVECYGKDSDVLLKVHDSGIGIPKDMLPRLFIPFFSTKMAACAGLGLFTSQTIIKLHGGEILVHSEEGRGSAFTVTLPRAEDQPAKAKASLWAKDDRTLRILAIDDVEPILELVAETLRALNHSVFTAPSGAEGIRLFKDQSVDVVICDLGMPGMTGWDVGRQIEQICRDKGITKTPFVLLTGWGDEVKDSVKMRESGVDRVVAKPFEILQLLQLIREVVPESPDGNEQNASGLLH
jgi:signal transduction histidine kinase/CheY-like chemotaxis protein